MIDFALLRSKLRRALSSLGCTFFILSLKLLIEFVTSLSEVSILLSICLNFAFVVAALYGLILFEGDFFALFKGRTLFFALIGFGDATTWRALPRFPTVPSIGVRAIFLACVARLPPLAVRSRPPRAVAPVPALANRPRLSLEYLRATKKPSQRVLTELSDVLRRYGFLIVPLTMGPLIILRTPSGRIRRPMAVTTGAVIHPPRRRTQTRRQPPRTRSRRIHPHRQPGMPRSART